MALRLRLLRDLPFSPQAMICPRSSFVNSGKYLREELPVTGTGLAFIGAQDLGGDPATVKTTGLRPHAFAIDIALDTAGIERQVVVDSVETGPRSRVAPRDGYARFARKGPVLRLSLIHISEPTRLC